ncbi:MAG TPA: hypothetical protein VEY93_13925 [Longimicrobium sp.]|nr:hypothetical protein [Longimicrobium sp.]
MRTLDARELDRLMRVGGIAQSLRENALTVLLPARLLQLVLGEVMLYVFSGYAFVVVVIAWGVVPRLGP